jgi:predicted RNase H-like HicB family nuclease
MEKYKYAMLVYFSEEDHVWVVEYPELPGCAAHGNTPVEAITMGEDIKGSWLEAASTNDFHEPKRMLTTYDTVSKFVENGLKSL